MSDFKVFAKTFPLSSTIFPTLLVALKTWLTEYSANAKSAYFATGLD